MTDIHALATAKLESSGLTWDDAKELGITVHDNASKLHASFPPVPCLRLSYHDPVTKKPAQFKPKWPPYYRIRKLELPPTGFDAQKDKSKKPKEAKYLQEPNSGVMAYFPPIVDWNDVMGDPEQPIIITEGEFKAAKACKEGFNCLGLGGVSSFQSSRYGMPLLPELKDIIWAKRVVHIIYDSDILTNQNVVSALNALAETLALEGAMPYIVKLPAISENGKTGLDDYLLEYPAEALQDLMDNGQPLTLARPLWELNEKLIYIYQPGIVLSKDSGQKIAPAAFRDHAYGTKGYSEQVLLPTGAISMRPIAIGAAWISWPFRHEAQRMTYAPGSPQMMNPGTNRSAWNTWPGWGVEPEQGSVQPFLDLLDHLFQGQQAAKEWFLKWCAYPLQYPGTKLFTSVCVHGVKHGTGKSQLGYTLGKIYGNNFTELNQKDLYDGFNEWAENKQFVMGDDVTGSDKRHDADRLKKFITQKELRLNIKHVQSFVVPDCINYYFTANQPTAFFLEDDDRRFFIHEVTAAPLDEAFYMDYQLWLETDGAAALFHYLLHKVNVDDFNPSAPAMKTEAKARMIADVRSDLGDWVARLLASPEDILRVGKVLLPGDLFTNRELLMLYDPTGKTGTTANGLGRELRRVGVQLVLGGTPVRCGDTQDRYYIIRNRDAWLETQPKKVVAHLMTKLQDLGKHAGK